MELMYLQRNKNFDSNKAIELLSQLSVLGILKELPKVLKDLKKQFDDVKNMQEKQRAAVEDPLAKEI